MLYGPAILEWNFEILAWAWCCQYPHIYICLLGESTEIPSVNKRELLVMIVGIVTAARITLQHCKSPRPPTLKQCKVLLLETDSYGKQITTRIEGKGPVLMGIWDNLMNWVTSWKVFKFMHGSKWYLNAVCTVDHCYVNFLKQCIYQCELGPTLLYIWYVWYCSLCPKSRKRACFPHIIFDWTFSQTKNSHFKDLSPSCLTLLYCAS